MVASCPADCQSTIPLPCTASAETSDLNKFRQSSCGVQFCCCSEVLEGYKAQFMPDFVEEMVVNDDSEYKWIDKMITREAVEAE